MGFHTVRNSNGRLLLTPKRWVEMTNAIGIFSKSGRYGGGIFAHKDIADEKVLMISVTKTVDKEKIFKLTQIITR